MKTRVLLYILIFSVLISLSNCAKREGYASTYQYVLDYCKLHKVIYINYIRDVKPTTIQLEFQADCVRRKINVDGKKVPNPQFLKLAKEYGDSGEDYLSSSGPVHACIAINVVDFKIYENSCTRKRDVSDRFVIIYEDLYDLMLDIRKKKRYDGRSDKRIIKNVSNLTTEDLKWLPDNFSLEYNPDDVKFPYILEITYGDGSKFSYHLQ